jgi:hypothetical protein
MRNCYLFFVGIGLLSLASCSKTGGGSAASDHEVVSLVDDVGSRINFGLPIAAPIVIDGDGAAFPAAGGMYRCDNGKTEPLFPAGTPLEFRHMTYGVGTRAAYYPVGGAIKMFRDGAEKTIVESNVVLPGDVKLGAKTHLAVEGESLVFCARLPDQSGRLVLLKGGQLTEIFGAKFKFKAGYAADLALDGGQVYMLYEKGIYTRQGDEEKKLIGPGDTIPGGTLDAVLAMSVRKGMVAMVATATINGEPMGAILSMQGDKIAVISQKKRSGKASGFGESVATNGKQIAFIELSEGTVTAGKFKNGRTPATRLVVYDGSQQHVLVEGGSEHFGGIIGSTVIGSDAIDDAGNIAFSYYADGPGNVAYGVGVARPKP